MSSAARVVGLLFAFALLAGALPNLTQAEDRGAPSAKKRDKQARRDKARRKKREAVSAPSEPEKKPAKGRETAPVALPSSAQAAAQAAAAQADSEIVKEGDTSVKVMKFTGLGIEGRLKSPQLVYFVQRVRAEFERPELPHRSFMPELARTTYREPVR